MARKTNTLTLASARKVALDTNSKMLQTNPAALNYQLRSESVTALKELIKSLAETAGLDGEKVQRRIDSLKRSEYGRVPALVNLLTAIVLWPVEGNDTSGIQDVKEELLNKLGINEELLLDIKEAKGYHTFLNDDYELVEGVEPDIEEYTMLVTLLATQLKIPVIDFKLDLDKWNANETRAKAKAELDKEAADLALEKFQLEQVA